MNKEKREELIAALCLKFGINYEAKKIEPTIETKLEDVALIDGTMLMVDKLEVGAKAEFMGADGIAIPAEGEFELADGSKVICAGGVISEIKPKEVEEQPEPENEMAAILSRLEALESSFNAKQTSLETQLSENTKAVSVVLSAIDEISKTPVALSLESQAPSKKVVKAYEDMTNYEKMLFNKGKL